jgi:hypothetical protein
MQQLPDQTYALFAILILSMLAPGLQTIHVQHVDSEEPLTLFETFVISVAVGCVMILIPVILSALSVAWSKVLEFTTLLLSPSKKTGSTKGSFISMKHLSNGVEASLLYLKVCLCTFVRRMRMRLRTTRNTGAPSTESESTPFVDPFQQYQSKPESEDSDGLSSTQMIVNDSLPRLVRRSQTFASLEKSGDPSSTGSQEREALRHRLSSFNTSAIFTGMPREPSSGRDMLRTAMDGKGATERLVAGTQ